MTGPSRTTARWTLILALVLVGCGLAGAAWAQVPNVQATLDATGTFYLNQGVMGATIILLIALLGVFGWVIKAQNRQLSTCNGMVLEISKEAIKAVEAAKDSAERGEEALKSLAANLETRGQAVAAISRQVDINAEKMTHGFGNISQILESFVRLLDRDRDRADRGRP